MASGFGCWKNGYIGVNNVNLSDHARDITLDTSVVELVNDTHGDTVEKKIVGLENWTITAIFLQDFAASKVDATLNPLYGLSATTTPFQLEVGADSVNAVSATNPRYSGMAILANYKILSGAHGVNLEATATFRPASNLTRRVS